MIALAGGLYGYEKFHDHCSCDELLFRYDQFALCSMLSLWRPREHFVITE